jgi:regulator of PEP synthase PpsR (kinase-PPPase family)
VSVQKIFVVSDATAETAERTVRAALVQFRGAETQLRVFSLVRDDARIAEIAQLAAEQGALLVYTFVNPEQRALIASRADALGLATVDLIEPLMTQLTLVLQADPVGRPGVPRLTEAYFKRIEAVEFAVKHDDGQSMNKLAEAQIILVGISRTSKTPLSTYLAQKGWKVANVPLVLELPLPPELNAVADQHVFGLTIDVASLMRIRRSRLKALNMPVTTDYARRDHIVKELAYARSVFDANPAWPVLDVSQKAIEETAAIIMRTVDERCRRSAQD